MFKEYLQSLLASLLLSIVIALLDMKHAVEQGHQQGREFTKSQAEVLMKHFEIHQTCSKDEWLIKVLQDFIYLKQRVERRNHDLLKVQEILDESLIEAGKVIGNPDFISTQHEIDRMLKLDQTVRGAEPRIYAVTIDIDNYLENFWNEFFDEKYILSNVDAVNRGVEVSRIFIIEASLLAVMEGRSEETLLVNKANKLKKLIKELQRAGAKMETRIATIEELSDSLAISNTSFLLCDNYMVSESNGISFGQQIGGYVSYYDPKRLDPLVERFGLLRGRAKKSELLGVQRTKTLDCSFYSIVQNWDRLLDTEYDIPISLMLVSSPVLV